MAPNYITHLMKIIKINIGCKFKIFYASNAVIPGGYESLESHNQSYVISRLYTFF